MWLLQPMRVGEGRYLVFLLLMAGFWTSFNQIFMTLPEYIRDYADTSDLIHSLGPVAGWITNLFEGMGVDTSQWGRAATTAPHHRTDTSKGTKVFALAGKIRRGGLIEVPMGISIRQIVDEIGGGVEGGRELKAVQVGGPSGGCVPAHLADTAIDFEALSGVGAIMGSGGLVVLDDTDCMVDIARYFLRFTQDQSCGKCTMCRVGTKRMLDILDRISCGEGKVEDLDELEQLAIEISVLSPRERVDDPAEKARGLQALMRKHQPEGGFDPLDHAAPLPLLEAAAEIPGDVAEEPGPVIDPMAVTVPTAFTPINSRSS